MTWLFHSCVAAILLFVALAARDIVPVELGVVLMLGANIGGGMIAVMLSRAAPPKARTVPLGNLMMRGAGAIARPDRHQPLPSATRASWLDADDDHGQRPHRLQSGAGAGRHAAGRPGLPAGRARGDDRRAAGPAETLETAEASALDETALDVPGQALANVTREVVRVCETVEVMLQRIIELYESADDDKIKALAALDDRVDRKHQAIKLYLAKVTTHQLTEDEALRCQELIGACVKLEQVGDIIVRNMLVHVRKKWERGLEFTPEGWRELSSFHAAVLANARMAFNVLVSRDTATARQLVKEKDRLRDLEKATNKSHFDAAARRHGQERRDQLHPSRHDPRPEADQLAARLDGLSGARGAWHFAGLAAGRRIAAAP